MADNYIERRFEDYLKAKEKWQKKKMPRRTPIRNIERPDDEAL